MRTKNTNRMTIGLVAAVAAAATVLAGAAPASASVPDGVVGFDNFQRTSDPGWGTAGAGGDWTTSGGQPGDYTLDGSGVASMKVRGAGWHLGAALADVSSHSTEVRTRVALSQVPAAGSVDADIVTRHAPSDDSYLVRLKLYADGHVRMSLIKTTSGVSTSVTMTDVAGLTYDETTVLKVRAQTAGRGITTHRAKVWADGTPEPANWTLAITDSAGGLTAGSVGLRTYTSGSVANLPLTTKFIGFSAGPIGGTPDAAVWIPAPTPTPTPTPPAIGTYVPDATNTGVPAGTSLTVHNGDFLLDQPGETIDGLDVRGTVKVTAPNTVIKNSIIRGKQTSTQTALVTNTTTGASVTIEDSELYNAYPSGWIDGVRGGNFTLRRVNMHDVIDMAHIYGENVVIEGSWLHDNIHLENDPAQSGTPSHDDSIQIQIGKNITIFGNNISGAINTGIQFTQDRGKVSDVTIEKNLLDGGGCTINMAEKGKGPFERITVKDNTFGRNTRVSNCAMISPSTTVLLTSGNYFVDGAVAYVRNGS